MRLASLPRPCWNDPNLLVSIASPRQIFCLSGGHIAPVYVGAERLGIKVIDVRHECNSVFAADAYARMTGRVGVACVTAGPGVTNTITAVQNAKMAHSPVVIFGGATSTILKGRGSLQVP